ncbi:MAG: hypothetical protein WD737_08515 [Gemmatimonadota bacterium]
MGEIELYGEVFDIELEGRTVYVRHPEWSLIGAGESLLEAEQDLVEECRDVRSALDAVPLSKLSPEALRMYEFALTVV